MLIRDKYIFTIWRETRNSNRAEKKKSEKKTAYPRAYFKTETGFLKPEVERPREALGTSDDDESIPSQARKSAKRSDCNQPGFSGMLDTNAEKRYVSFGNEFWRSRKIPKSEMTERGGIAENDSGFISRSAWYIIALFMHMRDL